MNWEKLTSIDQLKDVDKESFEAPVMLFKHSTRCSISATALDRLERKWDQAKHPALKAYYIDLIQHRDVSNAIATKYDVEHQSPQVLLVDQGKCFYDNSHFGISYDDIISSVSKTSV